jgi:UDP:flavonoid glycosyltransferase YjiC (YdhE family)
MKMIRNSLFAIAAALMTLTAFSGTVAIVTGGGAGSTQAAAVA